MIIMMIIMMMKVTTGRQESLQWTPGWRCKQDAWKLYIIVIRIIMKVMMILIITGMISSDYIYHQATKQVAWSLIIIIMIIILIMIIDNPYFHDEGDDDEDHYEQLIKSSWNQVVINICENYKYG